MEAIAFYVFAVLITALFLVTVFSKNALYAMSSLAAGMVLISGIFFVLGADFLGAVQLVVYSGAVMALYAFGMMFFDATKDVKEKNPSAKTIFLLSGASAVILVVIFSAPQIGRNIKALVTGTPGADNPHVIGEVLFTKYLIPFEVAAVMLLVAMIAGIILAGKKMDVSLSESEDDLVDEASELKEQK
ncbi:MAG: NADH-quinone oxidoreductase subunit J [Epsilonproteobacteria bacterium]|nr:NADH-quinone oxidoreductase subunit J [Campylobacterota bacterium]